MLLAVCLSGLLHFLLSLVVWGFFYYGAHRNGWGAVLTLAYGLRHAGPAILLTVLFVIASRAALRARRSAAPLLVLGIIASTVTFAVDVRGDPQFQRVWFDNPYECSNRQSFYCTWWWWQPTRH